MRKWWIDLGSHVRKASRGSKIFYEILGVIGELLITAAIVLALFAFWQVVWTNVQVEAPRKAAVVKYLEENAPVTKDEGVSEEGDPPKFDETLSPGQIYGVLHIPKWDWNRMPLAEGTEMNVLNSGWAGHYRDTAFAGEIGNYAVAAHRRTFGNSFLRINELEKGDPVVVELSDRYVVYEVDSYAIYSAYDETNVKVIAPVPGDLTFKEVPTERWMTMTTCNPDWGDWERYIVHLKYKSWTKKSSGVPSALVGEPPLE
ncbi:MULTISPECIES: class E sortase [unclassified Schaalia]|uniref:class E sortase n=1 Tax=unclassified Schaalia TaxID=2691889 RepID=UPI001E5C938B|nr:MULTISPECIES: class E sortase [unclassified Schaalia]MCD4557904.1 class E sortase [Schaalia sp. lx-100]